METFRRCDADLVGFVDADCATPPAELARMTRPPPAPTASSPAAASRRRSRRGARGAGRSLTSTGFAWGVRRLFRLPYADTQCGAKVVHRRVVERVVPLMSSRDFLFDVDLLVVARPPRLRRRRGADGLDRPGRARSCAPPRDALAHADERRAPVDPPPHDAGRAGAGPRSRRRRARPHRLDAARQPRCRCGPTSPSSPRTRRAGERHGGHSGVASYTANLAHGLAAPALRRAVVAPGARRRPGDVPRRRRSRCAGRSRSDGGRCRRRSRAAAERRRRVVHLQFELFLYGGPPSLLGLVPALGRGPLRSRRAPLVTTMHQVVDPADVDRRYTRLHRVAGAGARRPRGHRRRAGGDQPGRRGDDRPRGAVHADRSRRPRSSRTAIEVAPRSTATRRAASSVSTIASSRCASASSPRTRASSSCSRRRRALRPRRRRSSSPAVSTRGSADGGGFAAELASRLRRRRPLHRLGARRRRRPLVLAPPTSRVFPYPKPFSVERARWRWPSPTARRCCCRRRWPAAPVRRASLTSPLDPAARRPPRRSSPPIPTPSPSCARGATCSPTAGAGRRSPSSTPSSTRRCSMSTVMLVGAFGQGNPGDEALCAAFVEALADHDVIVVSGDPGDTARRHARARRAGHRARARRASCARVRCARRRRRHDLQVAARLHRSRAPTRCSQHRRARRRRPGPRHQGRDGRRRRRRPARPRRPRRSPAGSCVAVDLLVLRDEESAAALGRRRRAGAVLDRRRPGVAAGAGGWPTSSRSRRRAADDHRRAQPPRRRRPRSLDNLAAALAPLRDRLLGAPATVAGRRRRPRPSSSPSSSASTSAPTPRCSTPPSSLAAAVASFVGDRPRRRAALPRPRRRRRWPAPASSPWPTSPSSPGSAGGSARCRCRRTPPPACSRRAVRHALGHDRRSAAAAVARRGRRRRAHARACSSCCSPAASPTSPSSSPGSRCRTGAGRW